MPNRLFVTIKAALAPSLWAVGLLVIVLHWTGGSGATIGQSWGASLIAIGSLFGLTGAYLALTQLMLMSRLPLLESTVGREQLVRIHKFNGYAVIIALLTHATLIVLGYAITNHVNVVRQDITFLTSFPYVLWSSLALTIFIIIVGLSISIVRRRLRYESWYFVHLFTYLAIGLAFFHQLAVGIDFNGHPGFIAFWYGIYVLAFGSILIFRVARPAYRYGRHRFRVDRVVAEADQVYSIYITGRHLDRFKFEAGQFAMWRFLGSKLWWQSHPFSFSASFNGREVRLTFKMVGDFTADLMHVLPGTPVIIDGPYGRFTIGPSQRQKLLFIAGGIGLTPLRNLLESLDDSYHVTLLYSCRTEADIALRGELEDLAKRRSVTIHYLLSNETKPGYNRGIVDAASITRFVPDAAKREVYLCGPPVMMTAVSAALMTQGVEAPLIHTERFDF